MGRRVDGLAAAREVRERLYAPTFRHECRGPRERLAGSIAVFAR